MLRQMGQLIIEQARTIVGHQSINVGLVGAHDAQRRLEILAREGESVRAVMRGGDDDEQRGVGLLEDFLESPGITVAAAMIVNVRNKGGPELRAGLCQRSWRAGLR